MLMVMGNPPVDGDDDYPAAAPAFVSAWHRLAAAIHATRDPQRRFDRRTETGEFAANIVSENAAGRASDAVEIQDAENLTLTALSERISMTKQAAGRLTGRARKPKEQR